MADWVLARPEPFAVIHGDYRLDNLMFGDDADDVVAVDWQTLAVGPPTRDVAYFLGTSVQVDERREHERRLVAAYHAELVRRGVEGYDADQCFDDYRVGHLQGPFITTLGAAYATAVRTEAADRMFVAMATRLLRRHPRPRLASTSSDPASGPGQRVRMLTPAVPGAP